MPEETMQEVLFPVLCDEEIELLRGYGDEVCFESGGVIFEENTPADKFFVVLDGEIKVTREVGGGEIVLAVHHRGQFTGEISLLSGGKSIATGKAVTPCCLLRLSVDALRTALVACPWLMNTVVTAMARRRPEADAMAQQREKLAALGMMAAGLAHEINNPASAAQSAARQLRENFDKQHQLAVALCQQTLTPEQRDALAEFQREAFTLAGTPQAAMDALTRSDREEAMTDWLDARAVSDGWQLSPALVTAGLNTARLDTLAAKLPAETLCDTLQWLNATLSVGELAAEVEQSTTRITELVQAVKVYSYMDQGTVQDVDIREGIESTLTILGHRLRKGSVKVHKEYDPNLPRITAYGSELTQVWTNLIVNALDAMDDKGSLRIRTARENDSVLVEISDDGSGIPPEIKNRIFEPFFTTKAVGKGTGMGLNMTYRIVVERHHGDLTVTSQPGDTRFSVRLPIQPPA